MKKHKVIVILQIAVGGGSGHSEKYLCSNRKYIKS